MKTAQELLTEHQNRIKTAVSLGKPDRVPMMIAGDVFFLKLADPSAKAADFVNRPEWANEMMVKGALSLGDLDSTWLAGMYPPMMGFIWNSNIKLPGRELPEDSYWQIDEKPLMMVEDYDLILEKGWHHYKNDYVVNRVKFPMFEMQKAGEIGAMTSKLYLDSGMAIVANGASASTPYDALCSGRSIPKFTRDLKKMPDKISAVIDAAMAEITGDLKKQLETMKPGIVSVMPGNRASSDFISRKTWEKFVWPHVKNLVDMSVAADANVFFHMDGQWDTFLDYFAELPKARCIFDPDSITDIFKIKEVLGGHMCITGDVPPALLTLGTPDEVYAYAEKLISNIGPSGFMMATGCATPPNTKPDNYKAMVAACLGK